MKLIAVFSLVAFFQAAPPVTWHEKLLAPLVSNWPLVAVAIWGIVVARGTLKVIARQAVSMRRQTRVLRKSVAIAEKNARAAELGAQAVINSERPWIVVVVGPHPTIPGNFIFRATNNGRTPAEFISGSAAHIYVDRPEDLPVPPVYSTPFERPKNPLLIQSDSFEIYPPAGIRPEEIERQFWFDEKNQILNPNHILIFYGRIVYDDMFDRDRPGYIPHETRWCFACFEIGKRFITTGPGEYNRYT